MAYTMKTIKKQKPVLSLINNIIIDPFMFVFFWDHKSKVYIKYLN